MRSRWLGALMVLLAGCPSKVWVVQRGPEPDDFGVDVHRLRVDGRGWAAATPTAGDEVSVDLVCNLWNSVDCPGCVVAIELAVGDAVACLNEVGPGPDPGTKLTIELTDFVLPEEPGVHDVVVTVWEGQPCGTVSVPRDVPTSIVDIGTIELLP